MRHAILLALLVIGCRQQGSPLANPFLASDRVPPPSTRAPAPGTAVPYYGGATAPVEAAPTSGASTPAGPWRVGQNATLGGAVNADALVDSPGANRGPRGRTLWAALEAPDDRIAIPPDEAKTRTTSASDAVGRDRSFTNSSPPVGDAFRPPSGRRGTGRPGEIIRASYEASVDEKPAQASPSGESLPARSRSDKARFTFAPDYTWLQGKLEHSQSSGKWKLRYIPIDGKTDEYGGSVILENAEALGDLATGDFVRIRGELLEAKRDGMTFAPVYRVIETQPVAD